MNRLLTAVFCWVLIASGSQAFAAIAINQITSPVNGSVFRTGTNFTVAVQAQDPAGIDAARLWIDGVYYNIDSTAPYSFSVSGLAAGTHSLMVRTRNNKGVALDSPTVSITVQDPPSISAITAPANGAKTTLGVPVVVNANAFDFDGVEAVRLWIDGVYRDVDSTAPYSFTVSDLTEGTHSLMVRTRDIKGNSLDSAPISITVVGIPPPITKIPLPVEVLGPAGTTKSVSFTISDPSRVTHLYLRCNACGYSDIALNKNLARIKASVRINGGAAIALKQFTENGTVYGNSQIKVMGGEASYGGIGGTFRTVRMTVPISGLKPGLNTLTFEHVSADTQSIGFRIIELNLVENGDVNRKVFNDLAFAYDDPLTWKAPRATLADISQGSTLWRQRNRLYDPLLDSLDGAGNRQGALNGTLRASCSSCHTPDGRDLKYFNFSNTAIIERSKFHGLTQTEAEQIASYIRSNNIPVVKQARPWNPTYQPGPGLDSKPSYEWAAGAGVDAVLNSHNDMVPYLFPNGTALAQVRAVVDRYSTLNLRELPVSIPMPEWNQWLPMIHPDDAFNTAAAAITSDNRGNDVGMPYYTKLYQDALANPTPVVLDGLSTGIKWWLGRDLTCQTNGVGGAEPGRGLNGPVLAALRLPSPTVTTANCTTINHATLKNLEIAKRSLAAWATVKLWEVMHSKGLEERSQNQTAPVCSSGRCINAAEARGWVANGRNVFDRPPHFTGVVNDSAYAGQSKMQGVFESNSWYHLNMVLNSGYRQTMPSHFAYTYSHVELLQEYSHVDQGFLFWSTMIKQRQLQTNGNYGVEEGMDLRTAQPHIFYGTGGNQNTSTAAQGSVGQPMWGRLVQASVEDFVGDANNATATDWANAKGSSAVQDRFSTDFSACSGVCSFERPAFQGRNVYRVIPELRKIGVAEPAIQSLIDWGEKTWPRGPWNSVR